MYVKNRNVCLPFEITIGSREEVIAAIDKHDAITKHALPLVLCPGHLIVQTQNDVLHLFATVRIVVVVFWVVQIRVDIIL